MSNISDYFFSDGKNFSFNKILPTLIGIILIRVFLESFSSPGLGGNIFPWEGIFLHFPIYYISTFFSFTLLLYFFTKDSAEKIFTFLAKAFVFMWIAPIADLIYKHGQVSPQSYVITNPHNILDVFIKLLNPLGYEGITFGTHIASYILLFSFAFFINKKTNNVLKAALGVFFGFLILFSYALTPTIAASFSNINPSASAVLNYYNMLEHSWIVTTQDKTFFNLSGQEFDHVFLNNIFTIRCFWLLIIIQAAACLYIFNKNRFIVLKNNMRFERIGNFIFLALIGIAISIYLSGDINIKNPANVISLLVFLILIILNGILAVFINDEEDIAIDSVTNQERPLIKKIISLKDWREMKLYIFLLIIAGTLSLNRATAFFLFLTQGIYYIYSTYPLRLKRHFITSSLSIGLATISISMAGFFLVSPTQQISKFPLLALLIIGFSQALLSNMKDLKDYEGDKLENINTLPVIFGLNYSKKIIAVLYAIVFISIPLFFRTYSFLIFAISCSLFSTYLILRKKHAEKHVFILIFTYMIGLFSALLF